MSRKKNKQKIRQPTSVAKPGQLNAPSYGGSRMQVVNAGYGDSGASHYKGSMAGWRPLSSSPQSDIDPYLGTLRARSRDLRIGAPVANSAISTSRTHVIGSGLKLRARINAGILGLDSKKAAQWEKRTEEEFDLWASNPFCDLLKKNNWYDMQDIAYVCYLTDGDSWAALKYRPPLPGMPYMLRIHLFEADRVCNPDTQTIGGLSHFTVQAQNPANGNRIINGVEVDDDGAVLAYWICNRHPYDPSNLWQIPKWERVEAFGRRTGMPNILQICSEDRPEQYRGVPYLAPVIETLKQVTRFTDAELSAAILKSFLTIFFKENIPTGGMFPLYEALSKREKITIDPSLFEVGPATLNVMPPGYDVATVDAGRSLSTYEPFTNQLIRQIGASLEIPHEVLLKTFNSSYSASRAALLQAWAAFKIRRTWFSRDFCQPVYEMWLTEAVSVGRVEAPGFFDDPLIRKAWCNAEWYGPVMGVIDSVKEAEGAALRIALGLSTGEKEAAEMTGTDFDANIEKLALEKQSMEILGLAQAQIESMIKKKEEATNKDDED